MFVTYPHFEQAMPFGLAAQKSRYWRAVELSVHMPWIVLTLAEANPDGRYERTLLLTHASDLEDIVLTRPANAMRDLRLMARAAPSGGGSSWDSMSVRKVWKVCCNQVVPHFPAGEMITSVGSGR